MTQAVWAGREPLLFLPVSVPAQAKKPRDRNTGQQKFERNCMQPEPVVLFHDPFADHSFSGDQSPAEKRPRPDSRPARRTTRRYPSQAAARAAALEAVVRDLRTLERQTATRQKEAHGHVPRNLTCPLASQQDWPDGRAIPNWAKLLRKISPSSESHMCSCGGEAVRTSEP
jgi:hypothetical protein